MINYEAIVIESECLMEDINILYVRQANKVKSINHWYAETVGDIGLIIRLLVRMGII